MKKEGTPILVLDVSRAMDRPYVNKVGSFMPSIFNEYALVYFDDGHIAVAIKWEITTELMKALS